MRGRHAAATALAAAGLALALLVALSFAGPWHGALDSLSHFRAHLVAAALFIALPAIWLGPWRARFGALVATAVALVGAISVWPYVVPRNDREPPAGATVRTLLQMNVRFDSDVAAAVARVRALQPDVVTLQEVTPRMLPALDALDGYARAQCPGEGVVGGAVVLSRHPFAGEATCATNRTTVQRLSLDGRELTVVSEHLRWPWPHGQATDLDRLAPVLATLSGPVIVGGDFNAAPWSAAVRRFAAMSGTAPVRGIGFTWPHNLGLPHAATAWLGLPLDNVLASPAVDVLGVSRAEPTASDHVPVVARFTLRADGDAPAPVAAATTSPAP